MIEVLSPELEPGKSGAMLAERLPTFDGKRIAVLWNNRTHGDKLLGRVEALLKDEYEPGSIVSKKKNYHGEPMTAEMLEELAGSVDAVITGVGD